ncbi:MAG TPA: alpha/beta fold hydrolase [Solirubrobacteraceae bacterium]
MSDVFSAAHRGGSGSPLVCLHGFTDTWRTWDLVLPALEREHDVLAPTLAGHAGGPPLGRPASVSVLTDALEAAMDEAGFETAHLVGNSLGGHLALQLAARGRARTVVALAPAGGWAAGDPAATRMEHFTRMRVLLEGAAPHADAIVAAPGGARRASADITTNYEHIPLDLLAHQLRGVVGCTGLDALVAGAARDGWGLDAAAIACPVRIVWGTDDRLLPWPTAAMRYREDWLPNADWVELEGVGHCPQLDVPLETAQLILGFTADRRAR